MPVNQPLGTGNGRIIIGANDGLISLDMAVVAQDVGAIFGQVTRKLFRRS
jgi:hypothetical protein